MPLYSTTFLFHIMDSMLRSFCLSLTFEASPRTACSLPLLFRHQLNLIVCSTCMTGQPCELNNGGLPRGPGGGGGVVNSPLDAKKEVVKVISAADRHYIEGGWDGVPLG
jgi:hypothetical protein